MTEVVVEIFTILILSGGIGVVLMIIQRRQKEDIDEGDFDPPDEAA